MPRVSFNDAYKEWRNRARKFYPQSIVLESLRLLCERPSEDHVTELRKAHWHTMLMVKWVCQDRYNDGKPANVVTRPQIDELRQRLWDFPERLNTTDHENMSLDLFMRQLLRPQLGFQRRITRSFVREAVLLAEQGDDYPLRTLFKNKTGYDVLEFIDLSLAIFTSIFDGNRQLLDGYFHSLRPLYSDELVSLYRSSIARTFPELVTFFRGLPHANRKVASEYFEFPALSRYPFFRSNNAMICWHPAVFYRGLESFVHSVLSEAGQEYMERFSRLFEAHVVTQAKGLPTRFIREDKLRGYIAPGTQVPDGLLSFPGCNVFIESKAGLFNESVMTVGSSEMFAHKTRSIQKAIGQAWATSVSLREQRTGPKEVLDSGTDYLLVITNKDLGASRGAAFASMYPNGTLDYPNAEAECLLPLGRIYVLTIEDFERLMSAGANGQIDVPAFLAACVADDEKPATRLMLFEQHLQRHEVAMRFSEPVEKAIDASASRLERALNS